MKPAIIYSVSDTTAIGYCWKWRAAGGEAASRSRFVYYFDCASDAKARGFAVQRTEARGATSPKQGALAS